MNSRLDLFEQKIKRNALLPFIVPIILLAAIITQKYDIPAYLLGLIAGIFSGFYLGMWYVVWILKK